MDTAVEKLEKNYSINALSDISSFINTLNKLTTKKEIAFLLLETLSVLLKSKFSSFVEKDISSLKVICQLGEDKSREKIQQIFNNEISSKLYEWVISQKQIASLKLAQDEQFLFIPLLDKHLNKEIEHGMLVFNLTDSDFEPAKELNTILTISSRVAGMSMTALLINKKETKYLQMEEELKTDLKLASKLQKSIATVETNNKKIFFSVVEDDNSSLNGNFWWRSNSVRGMEIILIGQISCKGVTSAILCGYLIGEMNSLKTKPEILLTPSKVLNYLNEKLNPVFKDTGINVNAWYGVLSIESREVVFSTANHPTPFLIGPEQQVSSLTPDVNKENNILGVNLNSVYLNTTRQLPCGSKLIICAQSMLNQASNIGDKYDGSWLPQVLESIGKLSLSEMQKSLENILSENSNGTAPKSSRLALLIEVTA